MSDLAAAALLEAPVKPEPEMSGGRYVIPNPDGSRGRFQRVSNFIENLSKKDAIVRYGERAILAGLRSRPDILTNDLHAIDDLLDGTPDQKKEIAVVVERLKTAGGADDKAELGTEIHKYTELHDLGIEYEARQIHHDDVDNYAATLERFGIEVVPDLIEMVVVNDTWKYAGRIDRGLILRGEDDRPYVGDVKTGRAPHKYPHDICLQLACYANAEALFDTATGQRLPVPDFHKDKALVIHLQPGAKQCDLYWFDIAAGWEMVETIDAARTWFGKGAQKLVTPLVDSPALAVVEAFPGAEMVEGEITPGQGTSLRMDWTPPDEGGHVEDARELVRNYATANGFTDHQKDVLGHWVNDGRGAGRPWSITEATPRRMAIYGAAMRLILFATDPDGHVDEDIVRMILSAEGGHPIPTGPRGRIGPRLGELSQQDARRMVGVAQALIDGRATLEFGFDDVKVRKVAA